jgi:hypothetical protein
LALANIGDLLEAGEGSASFKLICCSILCSSFSSKPATPAPVSLSRGALSAFSGYSLCSVFFEAAPRPQPDLPPVTARESHLGICEKPNFRQYSAKSCPKREMWNPRFVQFPSTVGGKEYQPPEYAAKLLERHFHSEVTDSASFELISNLNPCVLFSRKPPKMHPMLDFLLRPSPKIEAIPKSAKTESYFRGQPLSPRPHLGTQESPLLGSQVKFRPGLGLSQLSHFLD